MVLCSLFTKQKKRLGNEVKFLYRISVFFCFFGSQYLLIIELVKGWKNGCEFVLLDNHKIHEYVVDGSGIIRF